MASAIASPRALEITSLRKQSIVVQINVKRACMREDLHDQQRKHALTMTGRPGNADAISISLSYCTALLTASCSMSG